MSGFADIEKVLRFPIVHHKDVDPPGYYLDAPAPEFLGGTVAEALRVAREKMRMVENTGGTDWSGLLDLAEQYAPVVLAAARRHLAGGDVSPIAASYGDAAADDLPD